MYWLGTETKLSFNKNGIEDVYEVPVYANGKIRFITINNPSTSLCVCTCIWSLTCLLEDSNITTTVVTKWTKATCIELGSILQCLTIRKVGGVHRGQVGLLNARHENEGLMLCLPSSSKQGHVHVYHNLSSAWGPHLEYMYMYQVTRMAPETLQCLHGKLNSMLQWNP